MVFGINCFKSMILRNLFNEVFYFISWIDFVRLVRDLFFLKLSKELFNFLVIGMFECDLEVIFILVVLIFGVDFKFKKRVRGEDDIEEGKENIRVMRLKVEVGKIVVIFKFFVVRICLLDGIR